MAVGAMILLAALALRVRCATGELWLDEVWSLSDAVGAGSVHEILTLRNVDNNHLLNSLWLHALGDGRSSLAYRSLSVITGMLAIVFAAWYARRWGAAAMLVTLALLGLSHPLVHYSSEARGYAPALCFAFAALLALDRFTARNDVRFAAIFGVCIVLGTLSHLLFLQAYAALALWSLLCALQSERPGEALFRTLSRAHLLPAIFLVYLYVFQLHYLTIAGASPREPTEAILHTFALFAGLPRTTDWGVAAMLALGGLAVAGIAVIARAKHDLVVLFALWIGIVPAVLLAIARPTFLFERYFLICGALALVAIARALAGLIERRGPWRVAGGALLALFIAANLWQIGGLWRLDRGHYRDLIAYIVAHDDADRIAVTGDQDFRHPLMLRHYARPPFTDATIQYSGFFVLPREGAAWNILHMRAPWAEPLPRISDRHGNHYELAAAYRSDILSGYHLALYRRAGGPDPAGQTPRSPP
jgi:uncharacterized membrane protein